MSVERFIMFTFICTKHIYGAKNPPVEYPDPIEKEQLHVTASDGSVDRFALENQRL